MISQLWHPSIFTGRLIRSFFNISPALPSFFSPLTLLQCVVNTLLDTLHLLSGEPFLCATEDERGFWVIDCINQLKRLP